ncbi:MAG: histidine kinase [Burkholderiales bacterium]|jgi:hypothetical protein|nr:histidine kinase [Nitrosomonadaceae bacterium]
MFKFLGNAIYKTPWWAMLLGGLFVLLLLALFTVPTNVIKLTDANANAAERRAVQREVDLAMKDSALGLAERVVTSMVERTSDAGRRAELEQALRDIAEARKEMAVVAGDAERAIADATGEATREAKRMAKEAATNARERAREAAVQARDAARERLQELRNAKQEARTLQERVGVKDESTLASFDKAIAEAEASVKQAEAAISELKKSLPIFIGIGPGQTTATESIASKKSDEALNFDLGAGEKRIKGSISQTPSGTPVITLDATAAIPPPAPPSAPDAASPPSPPLPPELRDDIRRKVTSDFKRVGIGSALILAFFPLFFLLLVVKYYIGRSRRAQDVAAQKTQEAESANVNRQIVEAKLMALQAQVEPHFLYNTLANVQALTEVDPAQANQMTGHLIQYLRASLPKMRENISTVGQEVELVRAYLNILKMRMGTRLEFDVMVPDALLNAPFPPLMLPSLVENAIKHGLEPVREGGRIDVIAEKVGEGDAATIRMIVKDTGRGFSDEPVQLGGGVGLANIRERLQALFADRAHLTLEANSPKGVIAMIEVPANGATVFDAAPADSAPEEAPKTWHAKTLRVAAKTHSAWANFLVKAFVAIIAVLGVMFIVGIIGLASGLLPLTIGDTKISGLEGMAIGTLILLLAFGILSIVALIVIAVLYGLSFIFVALAIGIPVLIILSLFPPLLPFFVIGFFVYWFWWRKRKTPIIINPPKS